MKISYLELKQAVYVMMSVFGGFLILMAFHSVSASAAAQEPFTEVMTALVLIIAGTLFLFFGLTTYFIKDDPDVWR